MCWPDRLENNGAFSRLGEGKIQSERPFRENSVARCRVETITAIQQESAMSNSYRTDENVLVLEVARPIAALIETVVQEIGKPPHA